MGITIQIKVSSRSVRMSKAYSSALLATCLFSLSICYASDEGSELPQVLSSTEIPVIQPTKPQQTTTEVQQVSSLDVVKEVAVKTEVVTPKKAFAPFTGKVRGKKVRLRVHPELDGVVVKELSKDALLSIVGEKGEFWGVAPLPETKAYIFRSFVLDNVVEGNKVNLRLEPSLESPVIGHMNTGDKVVGTVSTENTKWLEIDPPASVQFYVSKEFIENVGGPEVKVEFEARKVKVDELLQTTALLVKAELSKPFPEMDSNRLVKSYTTVIEDFKDFPDHVAQAKSELTALNEAYLSKKIEYLENKVSGTDEALSAEEQGEGSAIPGHATDKMKLWEPVEESLYLTWARLNEDRNMHEYYDEQKLNSVTLTGIVESYTAPVHNKPGSFIVRDEKNLPVGYVYSTHVNLDNFVGKKVSLVTSPRPNNNFAFPAFFVHKVQ